jgi:SAM-dependent methyltransferase
MTCQMTKSVDGRGLPPELRCPNDQHPLTSSGVTLDAADELVCSAGCHFPVVGRIPRFVQDSRYAVSFGRQWTTFRQTQLDSYSGTTITRDRLCRCLGTTADGDPLVALAGKSVLEAGCGAGRFTELLLDAGARVVAFDLSDAVDANAENMLGRDEYFICQADVLHAPVAPQSFDLVLCLGVLQHTPDPEAAIAALATYVANGGALVLDHYSLDYPQTRSRRALRSLLLRLPPRYASSVALHLARCLVPVHRLVWRDDRISRELRGRLMKVSPLVDYYDSYPQLRSRMLAEWAILDTHDTLTDRYKHLRSLESVVAAVEATGLEVVEARYSGNGVEVRAVRAAAGDY